MTGTYSATEQWLIAAMSGHVEMPAPTDALGVASAHRVDALVAHRVLTTAGIDGSHLHPWRRRLNEMVAADAVRHAELSRLCADFRAASLQPLIMKGAGLAYVNYGQPWERPHDDIDLWCEDANVARLQHVLECRGYQTSSESRPSETGQIHLVRTTDSAVHQVEIHLRMLTPLVFADALGLVEARQRAVPVPQLGGALTLSVPHALFLACLHRVAHHYESQRLIWLYDIDLLARALGPEGWQEVAALAERSRTRAVVGASLNECTRLFDTDVPEGVRRILNTDVVEPSRAFLTGRVREVDVQWSNLRNAATWRARGVMIRRRLFPDLSYMRARYHTTNRFLLPFAYGWRIAAGIPRWFFRYRQAP